MVGYNYLNEAAALRCTSDLEISHLRNYPIQTSTFLVKNSIDLNTYKTMPARGQTRAEYHIPDEALVMVMIGRLQAKKNPQIAISALIAAQKLHFSVHLLIVGPDEQKLRPALQKQAQEGGCLDHLHFTGLLHEMDLLQVMADFDLFLMPSEDENFGMSAAESMAAGLPILTTENVPVGLWAKVSNAGETTVCNEDAFCRATIELLSNTTRLREMGQNGKVTASKLFDHEVVAKDMLKHLERIVAETRKVNNQSN